MHELSFSAVTMTCVGKEGCYVSGKNPDNWEEASAHIYMHIYVYGSFSK